MSAAVGTGLERIAAAFAERPGRATLMPYLMGGHPDLEASKACCLAAADAGAGLLELGVPFSDPLADGPAIHAAGTRALEAGVTPPLALEVCAAAAERMPVVLMVYANVVLANGAEDYARRAAEAGASGVIVPDLPYEESGELAAACDAEGIALVPLVAPTTPADRLERIAERARGFVYVVSVAGTTGERASSARFARGGAHPPGHRPSRGGGLRHLHPRAGLVGGRPGGRRDRGQPRGPRGRGGRRPCGSRGRLVAGAAAALAGC